jgi:hypothetical protein
MQRTLSLAAMAVAPLVAACSAVASPAPAASSAPGAGSTHAAASASTAPTGSAGAPSDSAASAGSSGASASTGNSDDASFPATVAGLPVLSVETASALIKAGGVDGQAIAVAGYFDQFQQPCPYPGGYIGPLVNWCRMVAFTDTRASAQICDGGGCRETVATNLAPFFLTEASGNGWSYLYGSPSAPAALVLIGHVGDARQWACTAATQAVCAGAFVADRVAWAEGHDVPITPPQVGDQQTGKLITPKLTLAQVAAAAPPPSPAP